MTPTNTPTIDTANGPLYAEAFAPTGDPKGVVLVTHGYMEHCGRYRELAHVIADAGWAALTFDVRGHGRSPGPRGYIDRFDTYMTDFAAAIDAARALAKPDAKLVLLGHSHGGLITLRALCDGTPRGVVHAIVSSPYLALRLAVPGYRKVLARFASRVVPKLMQAEKLRVEDLTSDPELQAARTRDTLCFDGATARWFTESSAAQDYVLANASKVRLPTTWLVGGDDPIANPAVSRQVATAVAGADYHDYPGFKHEVFNERERERPFSEVRRVLASC